MLNSLATQNVQPRETIIIDASADCESRSVVETWNRTRPADHIALWQQAQTAGAAVQRNQGIALATQPFILFCDDDVSFEPECIFRLWNALQAQPDLGGVNAIIMNQRYHTPGIASRVMFTLMSGGRFEKSFAGKVIGPAINLLPEDRDDLPEIVPVEWLNLGCTIYRCEALPSPVFDDAFTGYSLMEDLALSLEVGKKWKLANARTARIFHDSRPADYKSDELSRSCMELVNRHFVTTRIMKRRGVIDYLKLALWELFSLASAVTDKRQRGALLYILRGKWRGLREITSRKS